VGGGSPRAVRTLPTPRRRRPRMLPGTRSGDWILPPPLRQAEPPPVPGPGLPRSELRAVGDRHFDMLFPR